MVLCGRAGEAKLRAHTFCNILIKMRKQGGFSYVALRS